MPIFNLGIRSFTRVSFLIAELNIACMSFALAQGGGPVPTGPVPIGEQPPLDGGTQFTRPDGSRLLQSGENGGVTARRSPDAAGEWDITDITCEPNHDFSQADLGAEKTAEECRLLSEDEAYVYAITYFEYNCINDPRTRRVITSFKKTSKHR